MVAATLSRNIFTIQEVQLQSIGIVGFKDLCEEDEDFSQAYKVCLAFENHFRGEFVDYTLQDGLLFKGNQLCVPRGSMRENLIQEKHNGSVSGYFGIKKTLELVWKYYFWPKLARDV